MGMDLATLINILLGAVNGIALLYVTLKKLKPEVKKLDAEGEQERVETDNLSLEGAKISSQILIDRVNELKQDLEDEKRTRLSELVQEREMRNSQINAERESRRKEVEFLRKRVREAEREARDYRLWAAKLVKQVVEAGKIPVAFLPTMDESDTGIPAIPPESLKEEEKK